MKNDIPFWMDPFYLLHLQKMGPSLNQGVIISVTCRVDQAKRIHLLYSKSILEMVPGSSTDSGCDPAESQTPPLYRGVFP